MRKRTKAILIPCAAAALTLGAAMVSWAASGWVEEDGTWRYRLSDGDYAESCWKKSGSGWYWLDEDGEMATDMLIEDDEDLYYVDESGVMVTNQWREMDDEDSDDDQVDTCWYYFGANGKAYKAPDSGKTTFKTIGKASGGSAKYAFDSDGKMLYGWVNESSERQTEDDAWKTGIYYLGTADDGALRCNGWEKIEVDVEDDDMSPDEDDLFDGYYWFYFKSNGKKTMDTEKKINGKKYRFKEYGNAVFTWYTVASTASSGSLASDSSMHYSQPWECWQSEGWFKTVPGANLDPEGYQDGEEFWFYADKNGDLVTSKIKKINGYYYAFNEYGEMLDGLYKLSVNDNEIQSYEEIESESDFPDEDEAWQVYYFGGSSKEGAMKTGKATIELDGESYTYNFHKSGSERGAGYEGIYDGSLYIKGRMMEADKDSKLEVFTYEDNEYLINTSGKIQKKKTNVKDADDYYYCTDANGIVTYKGAEKYTGTDD